jgi:two-component system nitrate/nitrite response regulator NarL
MWGANETLERRSATLAVIAEPLFREGVARLLETQAGFSVVASGAEIHDAVNIARTFRPDIMLIDRSVAESAVSIVTQLAKVSPAIKVVLMSGAEDEEHLAEALRAGARGYVLSRVTGHELIGMLLTVQAGEEYVPPGVAARLLGIRKAAEKAAAKPKDIDRLNIRETQILSLLQKGMSNREIAAAIGLSKNTVSRYVTNLLQKLHVRNRVEAAVQGRELCGSRAAPR